jgi:hypothetical protein
MDKMIIEMKVNRLLSNHKQETVKYFKAIDDYKKFIDFFNSEIDSIVMES